MANPLPLPRPLDLRVDTRSEPETGIVKLEAQNSQAQHPSARNALDRHEGKPCAFRFRLRASTRADRLSYVPFIAFILILIFITACNRKPSNPHAEPDHRDLAVQLGAVVKEAGGGQIWIKHPGRSRHANSAEVTMQVVATPAGYRSVMSALRRQSEEDKVRLKSTTVGLSGARHLVVVNVMQDGRTVFHIELREVPRLLRAAIVIDDMGNDLEAARKLMALNYPLTYSVLPYLRYSQATAQEAHRSGHEVMLHLPMEPEGGAPVPPGRGAILVGMRNGEVERLVKDDLAAVPYVAGVNNHMGSRATQDEALMADVMEVLANHRLYFIDSRTSGASVALEEARRKHLPAFYRSVFLDNTETVDYTLGQLREFRRKVEERGVALAIGHPHATTIVALEKFLPELERSDIELVAPSQIVRLPDLARLDPRDKRE